VTRGVVVADLKPAFDMTPTKTTVFNAIARLIESLDPESISSDRKSELLPLIEYLRPKATKGQDIRINFICTHNSRRSHISQVWAQALACWFDIKNVFCYSGGTKATALFPIAAETLKASGFLINTLSEGKNPVYSIKYSGNDHPVIGFSKTYDDPFNPKSGFAAVMTCSEADGDCPFIPGAEKRFPITYEDPKAYDNTPQQLEKYQERNLQIATELFYVFSQLRNQ